MELLIVIGLLVALAAAGVAWGADSRAPLRSREHALAELGLDWRDRLVPPGPHAEPARARPALEIARRARRAAHLDADQRVA